MNGAATTREETSVSIVRVGMSENKGYGAGYDAIFSAKKKAKSAPVVVAKVAAAKKTAKKK